ncbi:anti-sigma factor family protein [Calidifontibacter indicus]|uniref:Putative zinc finger protein n=1 Tax=Calidifontibacter indicus TaxID=419650 RepID=A0A3D9URT3_9MICO|nr:zf-HC2 domain-containing protein [Calidifontibacter indicus]REF31966.1 putative zinc finger protein [Calidifontibacter indicus]
MTCPQQDLLVDYVDGVLSRDASTALERHLVACQGCRAQVAAERELIERMRGVPAAPGHGSDFMAGLLSLGDLPTEPMPVRRAHTNAPATLSSHAPAQYVSARKPVGIAALAVVGCIGAAVVAIHVPADATQTRLPTMRSQTVQQQPAARVIGFEPAAPNPNRP